MPILVDGNDIKKLKRRRRSRRMRPVKSPAASERELAQRIKKLWDRVLDPASDKIRQMVRDHEGPARIAEFMEGVLRQAEFEFGFETDDMVGKWMLSVDQRTRAGMLAGLKSSLGIDVKAIYDDPVIKDALAIGGRQAASFITKMPSDFIAQIAKAVNDNFIGADLPEGRSLMDQIIHISDMSRKRARLIARDQTASLSGILDRQRQIGIGVSRFIWRSVGDARVAGNPSGKYPGPGNKAHGDHYHLDKTMCRWDDLNVYSKDGGKTWIERPGNTRGAIPGSQIQCRCFGIPVFNIDEVMKHISVA